MLSLYRANIEHHESRERYWLAQGRADYAKGSARKAAKWRAKARSLDVALNGQLPMTCMADLLQRHADMVVKSFSDDFEKAILGWSLE